MPGQQHYILIVRHMLYHTIRDKSEGHHANHKEHSNRNHRVRVLSKKAMRPKMS